MKIRELLVSTPLAIAVRTRKSPKIMLPLIISDHSLKIVADHSFSSILNLLDVVLRVRCLILEARFKILLPLNQFKM